MSDKPTYEELQKHFIENRNILEKVSGLSGVFSQLGTNPKENIDIIVQNTCELVQGVCCMYNRLDDKEKSLLTWSAHNLPPDFNSQDLPDGHICYEATIKGKEQPVILGNLEGTIYEQTDPNVANYGLKSYLGYPVLLGSKTIGSLCIVDIKTRDFSSTEIHIISTLAKAVSLEEERLKANEALQESEERYRNLFMSNHSVMLLIDPESAAIVDANPSAISYYGWRLEEITAKKITDINILTEEQVFQEIEQAKSEKRRYFVFQHRLSNGEIRDVEVYTGPIQLHGQQLLFSVIHDITERKQVEEALRESEERFRTLFEEVPVAIQGYNSDGTIHFWNKASENLYGYQKREAIGKDLVNLIIPPEMRDAVRNDIARAAATGEVPEAEEHWLLRKDGQRAPVFSSHAVLHPTGKMSELFCMDVDMSAQKRLQSALHQAQKMESIGALAGGVAHNFNNILMSVQGRTILMMTDENLSSENLAHLKEIEQYVKTATELTKNLLGFAKGGKYEVVPTDINALIKQENRLFAQTKKEIKIRCKYEKHLWAVEVDQGQIRQTLLNLYLNAWQAMPDGGELHIQTRNTAVDENHTKPFKILPGRYVQISVTDTGVGMDQETAGKIFEPFYTTRKAGEGTGLGLSSAYGIVKNHGGFIDVCTAKGEGTTFHIYLPASEKEAVQEKKIARDSIIKGEGTILLVDDEEMVLDVGLPILGHLGYKVIAAKSGEEAIALYEKNKDDIDMVILDMIMPGMNGKETYNRLKATNPGIKVLLSSGYSINGQAQEILDIGCQGFIQKPFRMNALSWKIQEILSK